MLEAEDAIALRQRFPHAFGLRGFPGDTFRVNTMNSYRGDAGELVVYTDRWDAAKQFWVAFAKGSEDELRREMVPVKILGAGR
jgi:hypothetical protein